MKRLRHLTRQILRQQAGFTLMEVMVAVGIGGIVSLGVSYMMENAARLKIQSERSLEKTQLEFLFDSVFVNPEDCKETILSPALPAGYVVDAVKLAPVDIGDPTDSPVPGNRIYTTQLTGANTLPLPSLRAWGKYTDGTDAPKGVLDFDPLPLKLTGSKITITSATMRNLKITKTVEIPDPNNLGANFVNSARVRVPVAGTIDVVIGIEYKRMGNAGGSVGMVDKTYNIIKTIPVGLSVERPNNVMNNNVYISSCRAGDDVALYDVERYVCDNMAGGPLARQYSGIGRWGSGTYVECKDITNVRQRLLEMEMCIELGGSWNGVSKRCFNPSPIKNLTCPGSEGTSTKMVVFGVFPSAANPNTTEPIPNPLGDNITEKIECTTPCRRMVNGEVVTAGTPCEGAAAP